jgi:hypothetical protein
VAIPNIFTEKAVGISFAAAFALWAWYLNSLAGIVMEGVESLRTEQKITQAQVMQLKTEIVQHQLCASESGTRFNERQQYVLEWIKNHERHHERDHDERLGK